MNPYQHSAISFSNDVRRSCGALIGIVQGILADNDLNDREIAFLRDWLANNEAISAVWPGSVIAAQVQEILADHHITDAERQHLVGVLQQLVGGTLTELAESAHVSSLAMDKVEVVDIVGRSFCLTGDFVFGPRNICETAITRRGGLVQPGITKKLNYLVIGGLGSREWKHGSFGTKVEKAMLYKQDGYPIGVIHEDVWASSLSFFQVQIN